MRITVPIRSGFWVAQKLQELFVTFWCKSATGARVDRGRLGGAHAGACLGGDRSRVDTWTYARLADESHRLFWISLRVKSHSGSQLQDRRAATKGQVLTLFGGPSSPKYADFVSSHSQFP